MSDRSYRHQLYSVLFGVLLFSCLSANSALGQTPSIPLYVHVYAKSTSELAISWQAAAGMVSDYEVFRDGMSVGSTTTTNFSDIGLMPGTAHSYSVTARNAFGSGAAAGPQLGTTKTLDGSFVMDGWPDFDRYKIQPGGSCDCGDPADLGIWAAVRGRTLYVAARTIPPNGQYDYFLMVSDTIGFPSNAPWAKAGQVDLPNGKPFIGAESTNSYVGWFNAPAGARVVRSIDPAGVIEGTLDLIDTFGYIPDRIYVVALAYQTSDGGHLVAESPYGNKDDFVAPNEIRGPLTITLRDEDQDGLWDRIDPAQGWAASIIKNADGTVTVSAPAVSSLYFSLLISNVGPGGPYYTYNSVFVDDTSATISINDRTSPSSARFYRVKVEPY